MFSINSILTFANNIAFNTYNRLFEQPSQCCEFGMRFRCSSFNTGVTPTLLMNLYEPRSIYKRTVRSISVRLLFIRTLYTPRMNSEFFKLVIEDIIYNTMSKQAGFSFRPLFIILLSFLYLVFIVLALSIKIS